MTKKCGNCDKVMTEEEVKKDRWITTSQVGLRLVCDYCNDQWRVRSADEIWAGLRGVKEK